MQPSVEQAEHTLETIRTLMERSQRYAHVSGYSGLVAGGLTLAGCAALADGRWPGPAGAQFAWVWSVGFALALGVHLLLTFGRARRREEPVWSRQARTVLRAVGPGFVAGVAVTVARAGEWRELPAWWLIFYGCGALATGSFAPRAITRLGAVCLALGIASLWLWPGQPNVTMAVGFGVTHLVFGACVLWAERRAAAAQAFWREIAELSHE
jgi:hypothetical protein